MFNFYCEFQKKSIVSKIISHLKFTEFICIFRENLFIKNISYVFN